jgi:hypothetical protein
MSAIQSFHHINFVVQEWQPQVEYLQETGLLAPELPRFLKSLA